MKIGEMKGIPGAGTTKRQRIRRVPKEREAVLPMARDVHATVPSYATVLSGRKKRGSGGGHGEKFNCIGSADLLSRCVRSEKGGAAHRCLSRRVRSEKGGAAHRCLSRRLQVGRQQVVNPLSLVSVYVNIYIMEAQEVVGCTAFLAFLWSRLSRSLWHDARYPRCDAILQQYNEEHNALELYNGSDETMDLTEEIYKLLNTSLVEKEMDSDV
ncbi:hypothetical protein CYMTET_40882 [Cymbomonas tetramitiformis]|uniref:Uncharacterized protein n=1 Tax=Cymbomonas tetramitiformis TaxID=36881 RepID=A0AAE0C976_9CHLO|nr:hypothetical protein CYMTET_40882 [Cymbomonas tetramitiformis]